MALVCGKILVEDGFFFFFPRYILFDIGDGSRVKFWQDYWCGETPLTVHFLELFRFCLDKEASVVELMKFSNQVLF